ncbi:transcription factor bHLH94 [Tripterygium wilfordii]|uniref:Transcription factor bHLH94 n=1 Tax=Tripterygium wilfordii TaxID=458696 RepID=A0A7J7D0A1_TRIWF|nr:transcription factor bHLH94-like [Tripterygium wilfordii]KAF5739761.1 transcription factor bHLH94 [Tripterygium wilfordii]
MALEAVVYNYPQQEQVSCGCRDFYSLGEEPLVHAFGTRDDDQTLFGVLQNNLDNRGINANWDSSSPSLMNHAKDQWDTNYSSSPDASAVDQLLPEVLPTITMEPPPVQAGRRKRRRTKSTKNKEEIENQRMTHIAVERNRRKQMNDYLAVLRSLMPSSYVQRGDQASIIGGAINFVKELEQLLQSMEAHKRTKQHPEVPNCFSASPFAEFFSFPQYSTRTPQSPDEAMAADHQSLSVADIEVTMVESHANLKILSKKRPRQLLKLVVGLQGLRLSIMHLNVTSVDQLVLYSVSVKVEEGCELNTVDEIAAAVNQMLHRIEEETAAFS